MTITPSRELLYLVCAAIPASAGAFLDIETRRIPNWLTVSSILVGLALHQTFGGWPGAGMAALAGLVGGAAFFLFFAVGGMGAGDIKMIAAVSLIAGFGNLVEVLVAIALAGGMFALVLALIRGRLRSTAANVGRLIQHHAMAGIAPHPDLNLLSSKALRLPYGVPIAAGCWIVLAGRIVLSH